MNRTLRHVPELNFTVTAVIHAHRVEFTIYDIEGWEEGSRPGVFDAPRWHKAGAHSHPCVVDRLEDAEPFLHGEVKWDGCSNWHFDEQDRVMLHGCCKKDVQRLGDVMALCWDWAGELAPSWVTSK